MKERTTAGWQELLGGAGVPHAPVWDYPTLFAQPQAAARGLKLSVRDPIGSSVDLVGSPFHIAGSAQSAPTFPPTLGEHTDALLRELAGLDSVRLADLHARGVIG